MIPSKKVFALILVSISLVTCAFIYAEYKNESENSPTYTAEEQTSNLVAGTVDTYKDTDGDGLKDWEELLWGTDPNVPDAEKIKEKKPVSKAATKDLTATDKLARSFFSQYMNLKEVGLQNDKETRERTVDGLLAANLQPEVPPTFTIESIKTSPNITIRDYGNAAARIIKTNTVSTRSEISIFRDALSTENPRVIQELLPSVKGYKDMTDQLLKLTVPSSVASSHLRLVNAISRISFIIDSFSKVFVDPVKSIQSLAIFQASFDEMVYSFGDIVKILRSNNISYTIDEPGYFFLKTQ